MSIFMHDSGVAGNYLTRHFDDPDLGVSGEIRMGLSLGPDHTVPLEVVAYPGDGMGVDETDEIVHAHEDMDPDKAYFVVRSETNATQHVRGCLESGRLALGGIIPKVA